MLTITVLGEEYFNDETQEFITVGDVVVALEHSLASLSKWESIYEKPFLAPSEKTTEEVLGYIRLMCIDPDVPPEVFSKFTPEHYTQINEYINAKRSATWFNEAVQGGRNAETITSELIYYWMVAYEIPFECENWHISRLFNLIRICNVKNSKPKQKSRSERLTTQSQLNAQRRAASGSQG